MEWLAPFASSPVYLREQVVELICWKFQSRALYRNRALEGIDGDRWSRADTLIRRALASSDDMEALAPLLGSRGGIRGFGPAMASVILAANQPERFTIADSQALASLRVLGRLPEGPKTFMVTDWVPYLAACRSIRSRCGFSLREIDQALWAARGSSDPPAV